MPLRVRGPLNREVGRQLRADLQQSFEQGHRAFRLDLSEVDFVDSAGLGALVSLRKAALREDFDLQVETPSAHLERMLRMTRLDTFVLGQVA